MKHSGRNIGRLLLCAALALAVLTGAAPGQARAEKAGETCTHRLVFTDITPTRIWYRCEGCGLVLWKDNDSVRNAVPGLVRDEEGKDADYTSGVTRDGEKRILTVTPETEENDPRGFCLRVKPADLEAWKEEGIGAVRLDRNGTVLEISLEAEPDGWFGADAAGEKPASYGFLLRPGDKGMKVKVTALTAGGEKPARRLEGITLKTDGAEIPVTVNGTWAAESGN